MSDYKTYKDLDVYQLAHALGVRIHHFSLELPKTEQYETGSQLRRSSKSISANIVEGFGRRRYKAEFVRFLVFAHSSCNETIEWLEYAKDCYPDLSKSADEILEKLDILGRKRSQSITLIS